MPHKYGILINEDTLDLIQYLNGGVRPWHSAIGDYYLFDMSEKNADVENPDIKSEDNLYDEKGHLKEDITLLIG